MNGHAQRQHGPTAHPSLYSHSPSGVPAPDGYAYNHAGQLVQLAYQPWMFNPQLPWESFGNPAYASLMQNRSTIELQPGADPTVGKAYGQDPLGRAVPPLTHQDVALVPMDAYQPNPNIDLPTQDNGTLALTGVGARGAVARIAYRYRAKSLISYVEVPSPDADFALATVDPTQPSPLNVPPTQASLIVPPIGGCVSIAQIAFGHLGSQLNALYDVPPGQIIHVPFGGSFGQTDSMLVPKYYTPTIDPVTGFRIYLVTPAGVDILTTKAWNTLTQNVLPLNGFTNPNLVPYMGWFAEAFAFSNTVFSQPVRRFYGSCFCTAVPANPLADPPVNADQVTVCPVAWFASQVTLVGNPGLLMVIQTLTSTGGIAQQYGPFPANQAVTMPAGATQILVWAGTNLTQPGVARLEVPFELDYTLSF